MFFFLRDRYDLLYKDARTHLNKPDRVTLRPDCVLACIEFGAKHVICMERQMDEQTDETIE